jgi:hypothetical protein
MEHIVAHNAQEAVELIWVEHTHVGARRLDARASNPIMLAGGRLRTEDSVGGGEVDLDSQSVSERVGDTRAELGQQFHASEHRRIKVTHSNQDPGSAGCTRQG